MKLHNREEKQIDRSEIDDTEICHHHQMAKIFQTFFFFFVELSSVGLLEKFVLTFHISNKSIIVVLAFFRIRGNQVVENKKKR